MPQSKILLDSTSYFRLAKSIHPLLDVEFGTENYCLYVLNELDHEFDNNPRLQTKFAWVNNPEYRDNRTKKLYLSRKDKRAIKNTWGFIWDHTINNQIGLSRIDVIGLSHGYVLGIPVVTDDGDMREVAAVHVIQKMKTLELLALMLKCEHITMDKVRQIAAYWDYEIDKPKDFHKDYKRLFGELPP